MGNFRQRVPHILGIEGSTAVNGATAHQRQHDRGFESIHVLLRHRGNQYYRWVLMRELRRGIQPCSFDQCAPWLEIRSSATGTARREHDGRDAFQFDHRHCAHEGRRMSRKGEAETR